MSILQITVKELLYHRKNFYETQKVHGIPCVIKSIGDNKEDTHDFYGDVNDETTYNKQISSFLTYDGAPTIRTLKSLGMYVEKEDPPVLAFIPVFYLDENELPAEFLPKVDDIVEIIVNPIDTQRSTRKYLIKSFEGKGFPSVIYYVCKIVPHRIDVDAPLPDPLPSA